MQGDGGMEGTGNPGNSLPKRWGGMALDVHRILPVLILQREGPPRLAAVGVWAPPQPSSDDRERGNYMRAPLQPRRAGESRGVYLGGELLFKIRLCF